MGWLDDLVDTAKDVGGGVVNALDTASDVLIDKDAWSNTAQAILDGPGGRTVNGEDLVNMLLDSTMLIPGAGLVGGAARVGARTLAKTAAKEGAENLAQKATVSSLRSPVNNAIRGKVDDTAQLLKGKVTGIGGSTGKRGVQKNLELNGLVTKSAGRTPLRNQMGRMAAKKEAGVGTKVGMGQSRRRILANAGLTGGANLLTRGYDELFAGGGGVATGPVASGATVGAAAGSGGGAPSGIYIVGADGSQQAMPQGFMDALAAFMKQNGTAAGSQVIYNQ